MITPVDAEISQRFGDNPTKNLPASSWIIQQFGNYQPDGHTGIDYAVPVGTPFRAVTGGTVLHVGYFGGTYADNPYWISPGFAGFCYVIDHGAFIGIYGHGQDRGSWVNAGDRVTEGQVVGRTGNTGGSTGPHLHFEILPDGYVVNSYMYGRINPETLFTGSLSYASETITPQSATASEEDELSAAAELDVSRVRQILEDWEQKNISARIVNIDARTAALIETTKYVKGPDEPQLYEINEATGELRNIGGAEWEATGKDYRILPQATINRLLGKAS